MSDEGFETHLDRLAEIEEGLRSDLVSKDLKIAALERASARWSWDHWFGYVGTTVGVLFAALLALGVLYLFIRWAAAPGLQSAIVCSADQAGGMSCR